ncbi:hypothetical protein KFL_001810170 [Klebsormidium nitens]|uniref:Uncharacterized protein n=1 Tax=Klebsormidium nitens TaxID=105231 RepID=A0A1Y1I686_KLENI|nr:hypothetical protein KFL_001810170 [Klebsormidium nitens]|eukprot:GAQ84237.1 hypothetical protein KFL_001810170 [Klebsormidium nitens]
MSDLESFQSRGRSQGGGSLSSGREGDVSDGSVESGTSLQKQFSTDEKAGRLRYGRSPTAPRGFPVWGVQRPSRLEATEAVTSEGMQEAQGEQILGPEAGMEELWGGEDGWPELASYDQENLNNGGAFENQRALSGRDAGAHSEPSKSPGVRSRGSPYIGGEEMKYFPGVGESAPVEESPRSPLGRTRHIPEPLDEASESADSTHSFLADEASHGTSPGRASASSAHSQQLELREEMSGAPSASSGEESTSRQKQNLWWQLGASPNTLTRKGTTSGGVVLGEPEGELLQLRKALGAAEVSARRWKAAATAADAQARGFQVALAATEQTTQALNNRHVGEFAAAWERIREMETRMTEMVQTHEAQLARLQAELAAKQRTIDANQALAGNVKRLEAENVALSNALETIKSERDRSGAAKLGEEERLKQLEEELAEARADAARWEAKNEADRRARMAEAEEALEGAKRQARDALQEAESTWRDSSAKWDAKRVEELREKDLEIERLLEVAEEQAHEIAALREEVSELQGGASDVEWMKERMAGFERDVIQDVSDLSQALEEKEGVVNALREALETARNALVEAEENLRQEDRKHRVAAAAKARDFAAELNEVEELYRSELQKKEGQIRDFELELAAAKNEFAEQADVLERLRVELVEEREKNGTRMAEVASEVDELRARVEGAETAGKVAAALRSELESCRLECEALRDKYTNQQLEDVELGQQVLAAQQQLETERMRFTSQETELRERLGEVETVHREARLRIQGLESELGGVREALGGAGGPVELLAAIRDLRREADGLRGSLTDALSQVEALQGMEEQATAKSERMKELRKALSKARDALAELQATSEAEKQGLTEQVGKALEEARTEKGARERAEAENAAQIAELLRCLQGTEKALSASQGELRTEQALRRAAEERNAESGAEILRLVASFERKIEEKGRLEGEVSKLRGDLEQKEVEARVAVQALEAKVAEMQAQLTQAEAEREGFEGRVATLEGQLKEKSEGLRKLSVELEALEGQSVQNRASMVLVERLRGELAQVTSESEEARRELETRDGELRAALRGRDDSRAEALRLAAELTEERARGEKQSEEMKRHVQAAADEYRRAKAAVKAELDQVNEVMEQERVAASLALRDAQQLQHDAEDRCEGLELDLRATEQTLHMQTAEIAQLRDEAARAGQETSRLRQQEDGLEAELGVLREEVRGYKEAVREEAEEVGKLRKGVKSKERVIASLEENLKRVNVELVASEKQATAVGKDAERDRRGKKELARKAEAAAAAAEKSAQEKTEFEKGLAEIAKKLERAQKSKERLEKEVVRSEKERHALAVAVREAEAALALVHAEVDDVKAQLATCQSVMMSAEAEEKSLAASLAECERGRLEALEAQSAAQRERAEALDGLQEALGVVEAVRAQKEQAVRDLAEATREGAEARETAKGAVEAAEQAAKDKQTVLEEKDAMAAAMAGVLRSVEQERARLLAMARAAAAELAHEMHKVQQLKASLRRSAPLEPPVPALPLPEPWPEGFLVKQYLSSDLTISTKAAGFDTADWVPRKRPVAPAEGFLKLRNGEGERAEMMDRGTNTDSIVVDRGGLALADRGTGTDAGIQTEFENKLGDVTAPKGNEAAVLDAASNISRQVETLRSQLAVTEHELETVRAAFTERVSLLEADLIAGRQALESVQFRNQELEVEVGGHAARVQVLTAESVQAREAWTLRATESDAAHSAEVAGLQWQLETVHEQLTSAVRKLTSERLRSEGLTESAEWERLELFRLSGRVRARQEERAGRAAFAEIATRPVSCQTCAANARSTEALVLEEVFRLSGHVRALAEEARTNVERTSAGIESVSEELGQRILLREMVMCSKETASSGVPSGACCEKKVNQQEDGESAKELGSDAVVMSLKGELEARERDVARLQKENRRLFLLVEQKEEEAEELQKKLDEAVQGAVALPAVTTGAADVGQDEHLRDVSVDDASAQSGEVSANVSGESELREQLGSAKAEVTRLRERLEVSEREREAAEQELKRTFADELRTAAEKYESARADFEERAERVEAEAEASLEELRNRLRTEMEEGKRWREECETVKERLKEREKEAVSVGDQYRDVARRAEEMREAAVAAETSRREVCAELERAVGRMRDQQEVLEVLQQRVQAAEESRAPRGGVAMEGTQEEETGEEECGVVSAQGGEGIEKRVAALDGVIEMWRTACRQKDVELATLRSALSTTQALLADSEERLAQLRTDFQRLDLANEDTCSELDRRIAEMAIAAKQLTTALQAANHPTAEIKRDAELADEGQLARAAMAAAAVIGMEARELTRMAERLDMLQTMQAPTPGSADTGVVPGSGEVRVRTPARKPLWLDQENVHRFLPGRRQEQMTLPWSGSKQYHEHEERALSPIRV